MTSAQAKRLEPLILLFAAGGFVGLIFPLAKLAGNQGLSPLAYAGFSALGASAVLALICRLTGEALPFGQREFHYALVAGQFTFAIPFGTLVAIIPLVGSGVPAILQSLAPIMTLAIVYAAGLESPQAGRMLGLLIGLAGVLLILFSRGAGAEANADLWLWYLIALTTPAALAVGNVYRSTAWPPGCRPMPLATLTLAAAAAVLHGPVDQGVQRVVHTDPHVPAGVMLGAALPHDDVAGGGVLSTKKLDPESFAV